MIFILSLVFGISAYTSCTDSDEGVNYYKKGVINITTPDGKNHTITDECCIFSNGLSCITEYECVYYPIEERWYQSRTYYKCPGGCNDGACKKSPNTTEINGTPCNPPQEDPREWCIYWFGNNVNVSRPLGCEPSGPWGYVSNCSGSGCARLSFPVRSVIFCSEGCNKGICSPLSEDNSQNNTFNQPNNLTNSLNNTTPFNDTNLVNSSNNTNNAVLNNKQDTSKEEDNINESLDEDLESYLKNRETDLEEENLKNFSEESKSISFKIENANLIAPSGIIVESEVILARSSTGSIYAKAGENYVEVNTDPADALDKAKQILKTETINSIKIKKFKEKIVYEIISKKQVKILALIKSDMIIRANIDIKDGSFLGIKKPWWSFLAF